MTRPFLVFEDTSPESRRELFRFLGVTILATRYAALSPLMWIALGVVTAFAGSTGLPVGAVLLQGFGYGVLLISCNLFHTFGHILAGRFVGAPMDANLITATRDVNIYITHGAATQRRARIGRSLGGPVANLLLGLISIGVLQVATTSWLGMFGWMNIAIGIFTLMPIPTLDGSTILKQLLRYEGRDTT